MSLRFRPAVIWWQLIIVLGLSLGRSGIYAIVSLAEKISAPAPLGSQTTNLNPSLAPDPIFDFIRQILDIGFALMPVLLVLHLIWIYGRNPLRTLGLDFRRPWADLGIGVGLFALIGVGTLIVYQLGRALGITTALNLSGLGDNWWTIPVLLASALRHGLVEEIIVVAWLIDRISLLLRKPFPQTERADDSLWLPERGAWKHVALVVLISATLRASYHLYQGIGPGVGNFLMGIIFALVFLKYRRVMPLVWAHFLLDATGFVGFPVLYELGLLGT